MQNVKNPWRYPKNWKKIAKQAKERDCWTCQHCGCFIPEQGAKVISPKTGAEIIIYLEAAHKNHDYVNAQGEINEFAELISLCPDCHRKYDSDEKQRKIRAAFNIKLHQILLRRKGITPATTKKTRKTRKVAAIPAA